MPESKDLAISDTYALPGVEIFSVGKWNGDDYTDKDLDAIVSSFKEIGSQIKPYVKLGHGSKQGLLKEDELPAAGWITDIRRKGNKIVADINGIPRKIYELLKNGGYRRVSSEIYWDLKMGGKTYPYALKAIAFLGGTTPAVQNLDDIIALYGRSEAAHAYNADGVVVKAYETPEDTQMDELKKANEEIAALKLDVEAKGKEAKAFSDELATVKADAEKIKTELTARAESAEAKVKEHSDKAIKAEVTAEIDKLIVGKKIMPAQKEAAFALLMGARSNQAKAYSSDGAEKIMADVVAEFFKNASEVHIHTETTSETGKDSGLDMADEAKKYSVENKVSYKDALVAVEKSRKAKA